jgi:ACS family tartrate transporter-like MFS transporter
MNGWHSDRSGERRWHAALSLLAAALLLVVSQSLDRNVSLAMVVLSGAAMGVYGYLPAFWSLPTTFLTEAAAAACIGLINSFGNLGGFVGNYAMGFLSDKTGSYAAGVAYLAGSAIVAAALVLSVRASRDRHKAGDSAPTIDS